MYQSLRNTRWWWIVLFIFFHLHTAWFLQLWTEPDAAFSSYDVFWYFYFVTATTVGYGDFSPALLGSRLSTVFYVQLPGIMLIGVVIGKIGTVFADTAEKIKRGLMQLHLENHTIVVGDGSAHTLDLLRNLMSDSTVGDVVLVSPRETDPMNGQLAGFVSGDINDPHIQARACFADAKRVIVLGEDDTTVTGRTIAVMDCTSDKAEIVVYFHHEAAARRMNAQSHDRVRTVASVSMDLVVQEALDPGAAWFIKELLRNGEGGTYVRCQVPEGVETTWARLGFSLMERDLNPLCLYVDGTPVTMPKGQHPVRAGAWLGIAAEKRSDLDSIDWSVHRPQAA